MIFPNDRIRERKSIAAAGIIFIQLPCINWHKRRINIQELNYLTFYCLERICGIFQT